MLDMLAYEDEPDDNNIIVELFCSGAVPGTVHSCEAAKEKKFAGNPIKNPRYNADFTILAYKAKEEKMLSMNITRDSMEVFNAKIAEAIDDNKELPTKCMTREKLEKLHEWSLKEEQRLYPHREEVEKLHRKAFEEAVRKGEYCSLDSEELLKDKDWQARIASFSASA